LSDKARLELGLGLTSRALTTLDKALQLNSRDEGLRALKARALVARGLARSGRSRIADFRLALQFSPEIFSPHEREIIIKNTA
jgi:hypothetical protein